MLLRERLKSSQLPFLMALAALALCRSRLPLAGQWDGSVTVPSLNLMAAPGLVIRPLIVAVAYLPILIIVIFAAPVWVMAVARPASHGEFALRLAKELRLWSRDVVSAVCTR
ncbi:hypothetical protein [Micromonospora sp. RP3T]|uniref:hypothetical protein n=1 Tax=Micromonospora sp. RP3T TaxID=2135446 RepID=UPI003D740F06